MCLNPKRMKLGFHTSEILFIVSSTRCDTLKEPKICSSEIYEGHFGIYGVNIQKFESPLLCIVKFFGWTEEIFFVNRVYISGYQFILCS